MTKQKAIIVDIDGCLANTQSYSQDLYGEVDWDEVNEFNIQAPAFQWCLEIVNRFAPDYEILFVTGRQSSKRTMAATSTWLMKHILLGHSSYMLLMRTPGDFRPDCEVKKDIYDLYIKDTYDVLFALDDRASVIGMWRELGIPSLHCKDHP